MEQEEVIKSLLLLKEIRDVPDHWREEHKIAEEKFQILVHSLQNKGIPKNSRKFVEELRKVRHDRWLYSRLAIIATETNIAALLGHANSIQNPKVRQTLIDAPEMNAYVEFVNKL